MNDNIVVLAMAATTFVKALIDMLKLAIDPPRWLPPMLALVLGFAIVVLLMVADGVVMDQQKLAQAGLGAMIAAASAVGVTELSRRADPRHGTTP